MKRHGSMNRIFRLVWSHVVNGWVAVAETACGRGKGRGRSARRKLAAAVLSLSGAAVVPPFAQASPTGGQVVSGSGTITQSGSTTTIKQGSQTVSINWATFNIAPQETVNFVQPSASSIAVNRIFDTNGSQILGHLNANGQVYLINPNGILFGQGAQVNVGGLVASTLDVSDASLSSGSRTFSGSGTGSVINEGSITAANGGYVALLGNHVSNTGTIVAQLGSVALGAGSAVTLNFSGNSLVSMQVDQSTLNNLAANGGLIQADGGMVIMTAGAADALLASVVNNTGVIEAHTVENHDGTITLLGGMTAGQVNVGGTLDASAPNGGNGGAIETSAATVKIAGGAVVTTAAPQGKIGSWLLDPNDFTIAPSGGDITGAALSADLASNSMTIDTTGAVATASTLVGGSAGSGLGDINVNDTLSWSSASTLTLNAAGSINVNSNVTWGGSGVTSALVMNAGNSINIAAQMNADYNATLSMTTGTSVAGGTVNVALNPNAGGFAGAVNFYSDGGTTPAAGTGLLSINGNGYTVIADVTPGSGVGEAADATSTTLQGMQNNGGGYYALGSNLDASATIGWNGGAGFSPIGNFTGVFDGLGHTIGDLTISSSSNNVGLFGTNYGTVRNVGLVGDSVTGSQYVGGLAGTNYGTVSNSYATGNVSAAVGNAGGLVGLNEATANGIVYVGGIIDNSYATGSVTTVDGDGGLVGWNYNGTINNSYATGTVRGGTCGIGLEPIECGGGGLVGENAGMIENSYATGEVSGYGGIGGLAGVNYFSGEIENSYATGNATGFWAAGGLVGWNFGGYAISNSHATGNVSAAAGYDGGLVGFNSGDTTAQGVGAGGPISNSYATGNVSDTSIATPDGGLVGDNFGTISNSYATGNVSGGQAVGGLAGGNAGTISNSYATGNATGLIMEGNNVNVVGGLVGVNGGPITNSYATGSVTGTNNNVGGLVGGNYGGAITNSFYDSDNNPTLTGTGNTADVAGTVWGMSTAAMQNSANFTSATMANGDVNPGWDFPGAGNGSGTTWFMYNGYTMPLLQAFMTPLTVTASSATTTYTGLAYSGTNGVTYSVTPDSNLLGTLSYSGSAQNAVNVGTYTITPGGLYSNQQGYIISYVSGTLTVDPVSDNTTTASTTPAPTSPIPPAVSHATAQIDASMVVHPFGSSTDSSDAWPTTTTSSSSSGPDVSTSPTTDGSSPGSSSTSFGNGSGNSPAPNVTIDLGDSGSSLQIQRYGVKLPAGLISLNP